MFSLTNTIVECGKSIESQSKKSVVFLTWWKSEVLVKAAANMEHTEEKLVDFKEKVGDMIGDAGEKVKELKKETKEKMGDILEKMPCYYLHKREEDNEEEEEENSSEKDNSWMRDERYEVHKRSPQHGQQVLVTYLKTSISPFDVTAAFTKKMLQSNMCVSPRSGLETRDL